MLISKIEGGCRVGFFGIGKSTYSLFCSLPLKNCSVTLRSDSIIDRSSIPDEIGVERIFEGDETCKDINEDILFLSPSVRRDRPELMDAVKRGVMLSSDYELFLSENKKPIFAVSGSDGKSTTVRMLTLLLQACGHSPCEIGNIGEPMAAHLHDECDMYVAELSSYMLSSALPRAEMAALTSLTPNHIDWHGSYKNYKKTKIDLLKSSRKFVISDENAEIPGAYGIVSMTKSYSELKSLYPAEIYMTTEDGYIRKNGDDIIAVKEIVRNEPHNIKNLMMAVAMADGYVDNEGICRVARSFSGLPHRCERFLSEDGIDYYDSSIDTSPARTSQTLRSLGRRCVIILGGRGKGLDYGEMNGEIAEFAHAAVLVGENKHEIYEKIKDATVCYLSENFESAVELGRELAKGCGVLLLSPASASYDMFSDFENRGKRFKKIIKG